MSRGLARNRSKPVSPVRPRAAKLSISLSAEDARWVAGQAERSGISVSAVIADAVARERRGQAMRRLIDRLGGMEGITEAELRQTQRELLGDSR